MKFILDANQAASLARLTDSRHHIFRQATVVLSPHAWAEILLAPRGSQLLQKISRCCVRFGVESPLALRDVATGTDAQALAYKPYYPKESQVHRCWRRALKKNPGLYMDKARQLKDSNRAAMRGLVNAVREGDKRTKDALSRGESVNVIKNMGSIAEAMTALRFSESLVPGILRNEHLSGLQTMDHSAAAHRLMLNPYTQRFVQVLYAIHIGYADGWNDKSLNVSPSMNRDDLPDMLLSLYANDGDVILTADKKFRRAYESVDVERRVHILTCDEAMRTLGRHCRN